MDRSSKNAPLLRPALKRSFLLLGSRSELLFAAPELVGEEGIESEVLGIDGEAESAGVEGFREFVKGEKGEGGAVVGF